MLLRRKRRGESKRRRGFSLIELSVVLIVIGLLLAAIMKGRDLIKNAEIKKFYNNFIKQWEIVYSAYYDRTGKILGSPLVVKDTDNKYFEYSDYVGADIEDGGNTDIVLRDARRFKILDPTSVNYDSNGWIGNLLVAAGMDIPEINRGYPNLYDLSASEVGKVSIIVTFGSDPVAKDANLTISKYATSASADGTTANNDGKIVASSPTDVTLVGKDNEKGNAMFIVNLPFDIAAQIDKIIDGEADGKKGNFVCAKVYVNPLKIDSDWTLSDVIDTTNVQDLSDVTDCGGPFGWGGFVDNGDKYYYVTAMYKLGI